MTNSDLVHGDAVDSLEDDVELWLDNYRHVNDVRGEADGLRVGMDLDAHFHDRDAVIGALVRKWPLRFVAAHENDIVDEVFLHFKRQEPGGWDGEILDHGVAKLTIRGVEIAFDKTNVTGTDATVKFVNDDVIAAQIPRDELPEPALTWVMNVTGGFGNVDDRDGDTDDN